MFRIKWLNDNRVIGAIFGALVMFNAYALYWGWYR